MHHRKSQLLLGLHRGENASFSIRLYMKNEDLDLIVRVYAIRAGIPIGLFYFGLN